MTFIGMIKTRNDREYNIDKYYVPELIVELRRIIMKTMINFVLCRSDEMKQLVKYLCTDLT